MAKTKEKIEDTVDTETTDSGIIVLDPESYRPKTLPLIIKLPETANAAQIAYAQILNGYAYSYTEKWKVRKDELIAILEKINESNYKSFTGIDLVENPNQRLFVGKPIPE